LFDAIRKLGSYVIESEGLSEEAVLIQESKMADATIICVVFELRDKTVIYDRVHLEEYNSEKFKKYLYRTFSHGRYDVSPTTRMLSPDKVRDRTLLWFKTYSEKYGDWLIQSLKNEIDRKSEEIFTDISRRYDELAREKERNLMFTIKIREGEEEKYLGDYEIFKKIFKEESLKKFFAKHNVESKGIAVCNLCRKKKEVLGFAPPFSFYTFDKKGFAPNFMPKNAWKCLPICYECTIQLIAGKEFLDKYLLIRSKGLIFYVIPNFILEELPKGDYEDILEEIKNSNKDKNMGNWFCVEDHILNTLKEKRNILNLIFMFIKPKQKDFFDIIRYVEDVPPSWIKTLQNTLGDVKLSSLFKEDSLKKIMGKKWVGGLNVTLNGLVQAFFPSISANVIGNILAQKPINKDLLIKAFVREIRDRHINEKTREEKLLCLKSFMLLLFLNRLELT